jgi:hypothetical protein
MDFNEIRDDETPEERPGCLRGALKLSLFLLVPVLAVVALLPTLLSSDGGRRWALAKINAAAAPARVSFESWSLGWFRPPVLEKVAYEDGARGLSVKAGRATFDRGLLRLLPVGVLDLGEVTLEKPVVEVSLAAPGGRGLPPVESGKPAEKKGFFFLPVVDVAGSLRVADGRVAAAGAPGEPFAADQVEGVVTLASWRKPVLVQTRMRVGRGLLALEGRVQSIRDFLKETEFGEPEKITLKLVGVDLAAFRPLLRHAAGAPWIRSGTADGALTAEIRGKAKGRVEGGLMVAGLSVEAPGQPPSPRGDVALMVDLGYDGKAVDVAKFDFTSPWLKAEASGALRAPPVVSKESGANGASGALTGAVGAKATVRLAAVARDFGPALGLSRDFRVNGGELQADVALEGGEKALRVDVKAVTAGLAMTVGGEPFTLRPEPSLTFKATFPYGAWPEVGEFHLKAPFADVYASGRFDAAQAKARLDLTRFSRDAKRIMKACPPMVGSVYLDVATRREGGGVAVTSFLKLADVAAELGPGRRTVVPQGTLKLAGRVPLKADKPQAEVQDATFELTLEGGKATGGWKRLVPADGTLRGFSLTCDMDIGGARRLLGGFIPAAAQRRLAAWPGRVTAGVTAEAAGDAAKARLNARTDLFDVEGEAEMAGPRARRAVTAKGRASGPLTQELVDTLLAGVNPLFQGSTALGGTVTLDLRSCRVEPGLPPAQGVAADMDVLFKDIKLGLGPSLRELLGMINVKERVYEAKQLPVHVTVQDGRVQMDPVELVIEKQPVIVGGWVAFDGTVNYQVEVPVTERLVGAAAGRVLKGTSIKIPVSGTVEEPRLDTGRLREMLGGMLRGAASERAVEKVGSFLEQLQRELRK